MLLLSSTGFTYGQHFCGGKVVADAFMLGQQQLHCGGLLPTTLSKAEKPSSCCENVYHQLVTDDKLASNVLGIALNKHFMAAFVSVFVLHEPLAETSKTITFSEYLPPPLLKDIPVLYQNFLI